MVFFMSEQRFLNYMDSVKSNSSSVDGISLISLNVSSFRPVTSSIFLSKEFIFAAKYNENLGFYSEGFFLDKDDIESYKVENNALQYRLLVNTKIRRSNEENLQLKMCFSKTNLTSWHKKNLKRIRDFTCLNNTSE